MFRLHRLTRVGKALLDLGILSGAYFLAFLIRFEGSVPEEYGQTLLRYFPVVVLGQLVFLGAGAGHQPTWRYNGLKDAISLGSRLAAAALLCLCWRQLVEAGLPVPTLAAATLPVGVIFLDLFLCFLRICGVRAGVRFQSERSERHLDGGGLAESIPTLLIGAGRAGAMVAKEIADHPHTGIQPVGFLDDDASLCGMEIEGIPVLGTTDRLGTLASDLQVKQALITIANRPGVVVRRLAKLCESCGLAVKIIPPLHEIVGGQISLSRIREVSIEDLLRRQPVQLDCEQIRGIVEGRTILVIGAGGSIGSELCRLIAGLKPATLVLVEQAENSLFHVHRSLIAEFPGVQIVPCIADICDENRMECIFSSQRPWLVLHAAAHKHVPPMEWNPSEAVKNNVLGTRVIARLADAWEADRFVMISTDKAVNPTSVMGVSKRVAELVIQSFAQKSATRFMTVRFGNVLGSNGSVIPIFQQQIASGGPVTVTHPEMKRYFMTIPEACQLVLQAGSMGQGGEIFILDMGEPVKIVDMARDLIRLSGLSPDRDGEIHFTGMRPGEKLFEELFHGDEKSRKTRHPRIFLGKGKAPDWYQVNREVNELGVLANSTEGSRIHAKFREIVPEYRYEGVRQDAAAPVNPPHAARVPAPQLNSPGVVAVTPSAT